MDLDAVTQEFIASVGPWLDGIEQAIEATRSFRDQVLDATAAVDVLHAAMDALPDEKVIRLRVDTSGMPESFASGALDPAGFAAQADAMRAATEAAYEDAAAIRDVSDAEAALLAREEELRAALAAASGDAERQTAVLREILAFRDEQVAASRAASDAAYADAAAQEALAAAGRDVGDVIFRIDQSTRNYNRTLVSSAASARRAYGVWGLLTRDFTLFGGLFGSGHLIGSVQGWHVALDGLLESAIALGEGLAALSVGIAAMVPASKDIAVHLKAVSDVSSALGVSIAPLSGKFQALGQAMAPQTVEAYGGALDLVNRNGTTLATVAGEVVTGIDDWIAKLDLWRQSQGSTGQLLQDGVGFLHQFEQAVDNVAIAVDHLMRADPGTAHFLMDLVVGATKVLDVITELPAPVLRTVLALHSFTLWGGLLATQALKLLNPLRSLSLAMGGVAAEETALTAAGKDATGWTALKATVADMGTGIAAYGRNVATAVSEAEGFSKVGAGLGAAFSFINPVVAGVGLLAAGVGYLTYEMLQSSAASQQFGAAVNKALTQDSATQFLAQFPQLAAQGVRGLAEATRDGARAWVPYNDAVSATGDDLKKLIGFNSGLNDAARATMNILPDAAKTVVDFFTGAVHAQDAANAVSHYTGNLANLNKGQTQLLQTMDGLISKGHSVADSLALMDLAGVRGADGAKLAAEKVQNLITGYQNLSVGGSALMNSVNAVTFASEQQSSKVATLTQAWSTFISTVTGGESSFVGFAQQVQGVTTAAATSANQLSVSNGKASDTTKAAGAAAASAQVSIQGLSSASLQLRSSFTQAITQGSTLYNSLETMASAAGLGKQGIGLLTRAGKDMVAELLPMTQHSKAAVAELYTLAQQAGYTGKDSFGALAQWVSKVQHPMKDLDSITTQLTVDSANLSGDVKNLANAISEDLNQAMAQALLQANGGQKAFDNFATALSNTHETASGLRTAAQALAEKMISVYGSTSTAEKEFITMAQGMHLSQQQAQALWTSVESGAAQADASVRAHAASIAAALAGLPRTIPITVVMSTVGSLPSAATSPGGVHGITGPRVGAAAGMRVPGYGGGDRWPALLEGGEAVVPKHLVPAIAPFLSAHHVPGFAAGGIVHGGSGGSPWDMGDVAALWARELFQQDRRRYGEHGPIPLKEMEALLASTIPGHGFLPRSPLGRLLGTDLHGRMDPYALKDIEYWKLAAQVKATGGNERARALALVGPSYFGYRFPDTPYGLVEAMEYIRAQDARTRIRDRALMEQLRLEMGYGGPVLPGAVYDRGGYLPVGLSMAYNGTGRPEPVGGAGGMRSPQPLHVHLNLDGSQIATAIVPDMVAAVADYNYQNSGRPTGKLIPGG